MDCLPVLIHHPLNIAIALRDKKKITIKESDTNAPIYQTIIFYSTDYFIFSKRVEKYAHLCMREVMIMVLNLDINVRPAGPN